jgi:NAD(P)-dependent dehydrogenase (short-subunit alcohol dehydrogenase family)
MTSLFDLSGQTALITGGSRGLGQQFARALAAHGADLVLTARCAEDCEAFADELRRTGTRVHCADLDVRDQDSIRACAASVGAVQILVTNAGCNRRKPALEVTWDDWNTVLDTNLRGTFFTAQAFAPAMIAAGYGRIITIGSVTCVSGYAGLAPYGASRGGVLQLTKSLADDWGRHGVTVNCLAPGWFKTAQNAALYADPEWVAYLCDRIPVKRPGQPGDLDGALVFLSSRSSAYVTGQVLLVDGGISTGATRATTTRT